MVVCHCEHDLKPAMSPPSPSRRGTLRTPQQPPGPLHGNANLRRSEIPAGQREDPAAWLHPEEHGVVLWTGAVRRWEGHELMGN